MHTTTTLNTIITRWGKIISIVLAVFLALTPASARSGEIVRYVLTDHLGSPVIKMDSAGDIITREVYGPYGQAQISPTDSGIGYTGHRQDGDTSLTYMQARYFDPEAKRFLSTDPVRFSPGQPNHFNLYWYAEGNPYSNVDPDGQWSANAHDKLITHAFKDRLNGADIAIIQQSSRDFDKRTQGPSDSYKHSMAKEGQSSADAKAQRDKFIAEKLSSARAAVDSGDRNSALKLLGEAIHPIMDSSSPEHTDANGNPKVWEGALGSYLDGQRHSPTDFIGNETSENLTPEIHESQDQRLNDAYDQVFGNKE